MIVLADDVDVSRGDMLVAPSTAPQVTKQIDSMVCWLAETPLSNDRRYVIRHTTRETKAAVAEISYRVDVNALVETPCEALAMNEIGRVRLRLAQPIAADPYVESRATGAFIVIDDATNDTVGAGMILRAISERRSCPLARSIRSNRGVPVRRCPIPGPP